MSILTTKLVATATSFKRSKNIFRSFTCSQSSTNPANFVNIDQVDVEIIGLIDITKIFLNTSKTYSPPSGGLHEYTQGPDDVAALK